jgi:hypothetical protein
MKACAFASKIYFNRISRFFSTIFVRGRPAFVAEAPFLAELRMFMYTFVCRAEGLLTPARAMYFELCNVSQIVKNSALLSDDWDKIG